MKFGHARVSSDEQSLDLQLDALKAAGCRQGLLELIFRNLVLIFILTPLAAVVAVPFTDKHDRFRGLDKVPVGTS